MPRLWRWTTCSFSFEDPPNNDGAVEDDEDPEPEPTPEPRQSVFSLSGSNARPQVVQRFTSAAAGAAAGAAGAA